MDTATLSSAHSQSAAPHPPSVRPSTKASVIQDYKQMVKGMVGLMLSLSHEGPSPALLQDLQAAASSLVGSSRQGWLSMYACGLTWLCAQIPYTTKVSEVTAGDPNVLWHSVLLLAGLVSSMPH